MRSRQFKDNSVQVLAKSAVAFPFIAAAATFVGLSYADNGGKVQINSAGVHGLTTSPAAGKKLYVTWATGTGVNGFYDILTIDDIDSVTIDLVYAVGLGTPTVAKTTAEVTPVSITVPGGKLGLNGALRYSSLHTNTNSGNNKTATWKLGGTAVGSVVSTTGAGSLEVQLANRNSASSQQYHELSVATAAGVQGTAAINTAADAALTLNLTAAVANEVIQIEAYLVELLPS